MIWAFDLLVFGLVIGVVAHVLVELRERRLRAPVPVHLPDLHPQAHGCGAPSTPGVRTVIGLSAELMRDGVHLMFYVPPNKVGRTSPITGLVSTRQRTKRGTLYQMTTASGSSYLVDMGDDHAKQVVRTFYAWKNGTGDEHRAQSMPAGTVAPARTLLG
jgi:hypothetical protein